MEPMPDGRRSPWHRLTDLHVIAAMPYGLTIEQVDAECRRLGRLGWSAGEIDRAMEAGR